jgi:hypothetical protein
MGLNLKLKGIISPNPFKLLYKTGATAGNESVVTNGYTYFPNSSTTYQASSDGSYYNTNPIIFSGASYNTQYWFKILDTVTGGYVIENIYTNEQEVYDNCINCCIFNGGVSEYIAPPTATPTTTPTTTPTAADCTFSGGTSEYNVIVTPTPTTTINPTSTPTITSTPTLTPTVTETPPAGCVEIVEELLFEDLGCGPGVRNRYLEYTITYKVGGVPTPAPEDITFTVTTDQGGTTTYTDVLPVGQATSTLTGVYTLVWIGETCLEKNSESYSVISTGLTSSYDLCTVEPPPTVTPTNNTSWYFTHGAGLYSACTGSYLEIIRNGSQLLITNLAITTGSQFGTLNLTAGDQLIIRVNTGNQMGFGCQDAYVRYDSQQLVVDSQTGYTNAEINVTVTQNDIDFGIVICGTIGGGICPL